jgi:hypothetical protein
MKLLIMQFFPAFCHFISLRSKYSPHANYFRISFRSLYMAWCIADSLLTFLSLFY